jgi:DNA repair protein RecO (recombination protein O)
MNQLTTRGIILSRIDYGEADRIITVLTPDYGKLHLMARGVRKIKSKLAGGIELFSVSDLVFIRGKGDMGTLVSSRLLRHYGRIVETLQRTMTGYELIKQLNRVTEDEPEAVYFQLLEQAFEALDMADIALELVQVWFVSQLLDIAGHSPNLQTDEFGHKLESSKKYNFSFDAMAFTSAEHGRFNASHIKLLRLIFSNHQPKVLNQVQAKENLLGELVPLMQTMLKAHIRV